MTKIALIARCDRSGGLANQTLGLWEHLKPARTLLLDIGAKGRGPGNRQPYENAGWDHELRVHGDDVIPGRMLKDLAKGVDVVLSIEVFYCADAYEQIRAGGAASMLYANAELWAGYRARSEERRVG